MASKPYRVLIADDHALIRRGLRELLESQSGIEVCSEASTGVEAVERVKKEKPDLLILDLTMPEMDGLDVAANVRQESPSTQILILTMHFSEELGRDVLRAGAMGYVLKSDADEELLAAVNHMRLNKPFFTQKLAEAMAENYAQGLDVPGAAEQALPGAALTAREAQVIQLVAEGKSNKQAAAVLGLSTRTVESHRNHIMRKMNFTSFSDLIRFAVRNNLVDP